MAFLRWIGGKAEQLPLLTARLPRPMLPRYLEAFVGGGALFFDLRAKGIVTHRATLADANPRLIRCYRAVRDTPERVADLVERWPVERVFYERVRAWPVDSGSDVEVAAWLVYVNHAGYGGLYRVNQRGQFNTPFDADRAGRAWQGRERLKAASVLLRGVELVHSDFAPMLARARNAFVYLDPPYLQSKATDFASGYVEAGFARADHVRLVVAASEARARGCHVIASNSEIAAPLWRDAAFRVELVDGARLIGRPKKDPAPRAAEMIAVGAARSPRQPRRGGRATRA